MRCVPKALGKQPHSDNVLADVLLPKYMPGNLMVNTCVLPRATALAGRCWNQLLKTCCDQWRSCVWTKHWPSAWIVVCEHTPWIVLWHAYHSYIANTRVDVCWAFRRIFFGSCTGVILSIWIRVRCSVWPVSTNATGKWLTALLCSACHNVFQGWACRHNQHMNSVEPAAASTSKTNVCIKHWTFKQ